MPSSVVDATDGNTVIATLVLTGGEGVMRTTQMSPHVVSKKLLVTITLHL